MNGISGFNTWKEDFLINKESYPEDYRKHFYSILEVVKDYLKKLKSAKTFKEINDALYEVRGDLDGVSANIYSYYGGKNKTPIGLSDTLDYLDEGIFDLEEKYKNKLSEGKTITIILPKYMTIDVPENGFSFIKLVNEDYPNISCVRNPDGTVTVESDFYEMLDFLDDLYGEETKWELIEGGTYR